MLYVITFVCIVIGLTLYIRLSFTSSNVTESEKDLLQMSVTPYTHKTTLDCTSAPHYCTDSQQCSNMCTPNIVNSVIGSDGKIRKRSYLCVAGVCESVISTPSTLTELKCNEKIGQINVFQNNNLLNEWTCINTLPRLFQADGQPHTYVCGVGNNTGTFDVSLFDTTKSIDAIPCCKCNDNYIRAVEINIPDVPLCISSETFGMYPSFIKV